MTWTLVLPSRHTIHGGRQFSILLHRPFLAPSFLLLISIASPIAPSFSRLHDQRCRGSALIPSDCLTCRHAKHTIATLCTAITPHADAPDDTHYRLLIQRHMPSPGETQCRSCVRSPHRLPDVQSAIARSLTTNTLLNPLIPDLLPMLSCSGFGDESRGRVLKHRFENGSETRAQICRSTMCACDCCESKIRNSEPVTDMPSARCGAFNLLTVCSIELQSNQYEPDVRDTDR